ncbi:MAG: protein translocase subunit SecD [Dehalococcoidia bacterium]|nr:MAG: protein translocase subunit SecD [Dehalococcoidia bacterium]
MKLRSRNVYLLIFILVLFGFALWSIVPINANLLGPNGLRLGLDLKGGSQLLYEADLSKKDPSITDAEAMASVIDKIQRRVDLYGVAEPVIQKLGTDSILVQLPGVKDIDEAVKLIGEVAELDFREQKLDASGNTTWVIAKAVGSDGQEKELTGKYLKPNATLILDQVKNKPQIAFEWDAEGAVLFRQITSRNLNKPLGIFLDNKLISAPIVQAVIEAKGVITNDAWTVNNLNEPKTLAIQLNSGALDLPLTIIDQRDVDASLGADSIRQSILAAAIGIILLSLFMLLYYRLLGLIACCSLGMYGVFLLAIFNLFSSQLTLTLPGIAGFILSLGMAVDANVLIFERMKEELRGGRSLGAAAETGFNRAWTAIRDSNITTFIACLILFWLGGTFGAFMVRGFALTLFIGVALSMFTAITVTRTFLRLIIGSQVVTNLAAYGVKK